MLSECIDKSRSVSAGLLNAARSSLSEKAAGSAAALVAVPRATGGGELAIDRGTAEKQYSSNRDWVQACIRLVAARVAGQRICVAHPPSGPRTTKGQVEDDLEPLDSHPLLDALQNPGTRIGTQVALMGVTVANLELTGRSLWWVTDGIILPIPSHWIMAVRGETWVVRRPNSVEEVLVPFSETVNFHYTDPADPDTILSPLQRMSIAVSIDEQIAVSQYSAFKRGLNPGLCFTVGKNPSLPGVPATGRPTLTAEQRKQIIEAVKNVYQGVDAHGEPLILDGLIESVSPIFRAPQEMNWLESSKLTKSRILQGFGVSPILLGEVEGANRASATVADEIFVSNKVNPLLTLLSATMTSQLAPMFSGPDGKLRVWIEPAQARDEEMRLKKWQAAALAQVVTVNEFRRSVLNLPDLPDGDSLVSGGKPTLPVKADPYTLGVVARAKQTPTG